MSDAAAMRARTKAQQAISENAALLAEIKQLRAELARRDEQIAAARALANHPPSPKILPREIHAALDGAS